MSHTIKGPEAQKFDGSDFRIAIVHARWNSSVIDALVAGAVNKLKESGVKDENIVVQSVPGSFELPLAAKRILASPRSFDAIIPIGVLIKGSTMHFEYISDSVSHAIMKLQMDTGIPVIFGILTALTDEQALERAGIADDGKGGKRGHNHGEDWGLAAVEMAVKARAWKNGQFQ